MTITSNVLEGVALNSLSAGSSIDVETKSRRYHIESLGGNAIRISGHPDYCPSPEVGQLYGSVDDEGVVELGLIEPGMRMMFFVHNRPVTTSRIVSVRVN
jgi:hypothetical protein